MKIETDLKLIAKAAKRKEDENWDFRAYLKGLDIKSEELDAIVHKLNEEVSAQIDCTECGNCCREIRPTLDADDIKRFAIGLEMPEAEFHETHLRQVDLAADEFIFTGLPCQFLDGKTCGHYDVRPKACASFPHLHKPGFRQRLMSIVFNYETCPIVYNVYERLKIELWPKKRAAKRAEKRSVWQ